jgi:RecB family exonuclease
MLEKIFTCPTQWFLEREAGGAGASAQSANVGQLVHAVAERVATGELDSDLNALMEHVDAVWDRLSFRTPWSKAREHERVRAGLAKFLTWHSGNPRTSLGTERRFTAEIELPGGELVKLAGQVDRLELSSDNRVVVVDLKSGRNAPTGPAVARHSQLALYQLAVDAGGFDDAPAASGGAELVQLGLEDGKPEAVVQRQPAHEPDGPERAVLVEQLGIAAYLIRAETFPAVIGPQCDRCAFAAICPAKSAGSVMAQ